MVKYFFSKGALRWERRVASKTIVMETILELTFSKMKREWNLWRNLEKIDNKQGDCNIDWYTNFILFHTEKLGRIRNKCVEKEGVLYFVRPLILGTSVLY